MNEWLLYGANGYTGALIAHEARARGMTPILAGRNRDAVVSLAQELHLPYRVFALDDANTLRNALHEVGLVLHCAGPFSRTARAMAQACIANGTHYLDITGELAVFEQLARMDKTARAANVMLLPGIGFDVVPTDCLAAHLKMRLPGATHLTLAWRGIGRASRGTTRTALEGAGQGGAIRRDGKIIPVPAAHKTRQVDFGRGPVTVVSIPWGDVSTAFYSTGIPNIEVYTAFPASMRRAMIASRYAKFLLNAKPVQRALAAQIKRLPPGPTAEERARGLSLVWGEVRDAQNNTRVSRLKTPEGYELTMLTALAAVEKILRGESKPGFQTPSLAFGADFILQIPNVTRTDVE